MVKRALCRAVGALQFMIFPLEHVLNVYVRIERGWALMFLTQDSLQWTTLMVRSFTQIYQQS